MKNKVIINSEMYDIPAVFCQPNIDGFIPTVILCHGTGSCKDEAGNLFIKLAKSLTKKGIASIRFDFAGCGDSLAKEQDLTFYGEVDDTEKIFSYLLQHEKVDSNRIGILGLSQGARVMAEFLGNHPKEIRTAVSWSGACHNGAGVFAGWFNDYYEEAVKNGYVKIPMLWREDLIISRKWFDDIRDSYPLKSLSKYEGAMLAISGREDDLVPYIHAREIARACKGKIRDFRIIDNADHIFNVLQKDKSIADKVVKDTVQWIAVNI